MPVATSRPAHHSHRDQGRQWLREEWSSTHASARVPLKALADLAQGLVWDAAQVRAWARARGRLTSEDAPG